MSVYEFNPDEPWDLLDWEVTRMLMSSDLQEDDDLGMAIALDDSTLLATAPAYKVIDEVTDRPYVAEFELEDIVTWTSDEDWAFLSDPDSWSVAPEGINTAVFSLLLADYRTIVFDMAQWSGSMEIALDQIQFYFDVQSLRGVDPMIFGDLEIASPPELRSAFLSLSGGGALEVTQDVMIGAPGEAGTLELAQTSLSTIGRAHV